MNHRDRVLKALQHEEPDLVPIYSLGFEPTCTTYQQFMKSNEFKVNATNIPGVGDITEQRFWHADLWAMHPWKEFTTEYYPVPKGYEGYSLHFTGRVYRQETTGSRSGVPFRWYHTGLFTSPEIVHEYWDRHGKPVDLIDDSQDYSPQVWNSYVEALSPYVYPMAWLTLSIHEGLFEGMTLSKLAYYIKKQPEFVHEIADAFLDANLELIKRFGEAGVEVVFYSDDFAQHGRSILSRKDFETFILPRYKQLYDACKKQNMLVVQHSCGFVDEFLPLVVDAGLDAIQSLEPAAGVDLAGLKENYGDRIAFLGGMDSTRVLCFGTPEDVVNDVRRCISAAGHSGGYFAGPAHTILDAPWENIIAFRDAIEKCRKYPLFS
ncbi:MAG TPA: uroporphyrinogen decarboxylase family protein [Candidatus Lokiarchaeia archaeon]|nr:uroporphyrinogen decarboxylase family protein [Candidatus Lokiarchaeia archaeon]